MTQKFVFLKKCAKSIIGFKLIQNYRHRLGL